ncbi:MAG: helix-turn-helix domain-containing protein, partial [Polyangiaceae bacterium]
TESEGSPFWLRQQLARGTPGEATRPLDRSIVAGLHPATIEWLRKLAMLSLALPEADASALGERGPASALEELAQRGLVERTERGLRAHGVVRTLLAPADPIALARALLDTRSAGLELEAARLLLGQGEIEEALPILARWLDRADPHTLDSSGLWQALEGVEDDRLRAIKLRCANVIASPTALGWVARLGAPSRDAPLGERCDWIEALLSSNQLELAKREGRALFEEAREGAFDAALRERATLLFLRVLVASGDAAEAADVHAAVFRVGDDPRADIWLARALVMTGATRSALALADACGARADDADAAEIDAQRAVVYTNLSRMRSASEALARARSAEDGAWPNMVRRAFRLPRETIFALELGQLEEARAIFDTVQANPIPAAVLPFQCMNGIRLFAARGELARAYAELQVIEGEPQLVGYWADWIAAGQHHLALLTGRPFDPMVPSQNAAFRLTRALRAMHEVAQTGHFSATDPLGPDEVEPVDARVALLIAEARARALEGQAATALELVERAVSEASREGLALWAAEALVARAEITWLSERDLDLEALRALVLELGDSRYHLELSLFELFAAALAGSVDVPAIVALARPDEPARFLPPACRRARAWLGEDAIDLDLVDRRLVTRARDAASIQRIGSTERLPLAGAWGVDRERARLFWGARSLDLTDKTIPTRLLSCLAERGGAATKEELAARVWGLSDYHPLRDDKRLQVAIGRLRTLLAEAGFDAATLETTEIGYRLSASSAGFFR